MSSHSPDKDRPTYVRLTVEQREYLEQKARAEDRDVSYMLRRLVEREMDAERTAA